MALRKKKPDPVAKMPNTSQWLHDRGWWLDNKGLWHNLALSYGWPTKDAARLEREAECGDLRAQRLLGLAL